MHVRLFRFVSQLFITRRDRVMTEMMAMIGQDSAKGNFLRITWRDSRARVILLPFLLRGALVFKEALDQSAAGGFLARVFCAPRRLAASHYAISVRHLAPFSRRNGWRESNR